MSPKKLQRLILQVLRKYNFEYSDWPFYGAEKFLSKKYNLVEDHKTFLGKEVIGGWNGIAKIKGIKITSQDVFALERIFKTIR